ncbi:hypothetical protein C8N40_102117 [Pontibacter mucosus]|uniref:CD-NTase associated protein 4-like DNA endonuclease domain-containing protein n=2 Tax=Pontibacter mucosus TaxID=1649266 RepID=A0A2T5YPB1_9BACT|nr:hypothetical protein C8N40_102117 [Pontibacter mucosus]
MANVSKSLNAGVHNATGIEFQKHCALFLLLDSYEKLKGKKYFICLEHHDDFLFCFQNDNGELTSIDAYQAKKSSGKWGVSDELCDILRKLVEVGVALKEDSIQKDKCYSHALHFVTNDAITLRVGSKPKVVTTTINQSNNWVEFIKLDKKIRDCLEEKVKNKLGLNFTALDEVENIKFCFIDFGKTRQGHIEQLIGKFILTFNNKVKDPNAAIHTLLELFREIETAFNQGYKANLLDKKKRVESDVIDKALNIITSQQMAFETWRNQKRYFAKSLGINLIQQKEFELHFNNSFDLFKDYHQAEHIKILSFVRNNIQLLESCTDEVMLVEEMFKKFKSENNSQLSDIELKAAVFAACIELINHHE